MTLLINHIPILQVLITFISALFCTLTFNRFVSWVISIISTILSLVIAIYGMYNLKGNPQSYYLGNWSAQVGIEYKLDYLNQPIIIYINAVLLFFLIFGVQLINKTIIKYLDKKIQHMFYSFILFAHSGYLGILSTNDLFNFYVFIEIVSLTTCVLLSKSKDSKSLIGAFNYLILGTIAATLILISIGFIFSITGSLNISNISDAIRVNYVLTKISSSKLLPLVIAIGFFLTGVFLKMAVFPLNFWMINAYSRSTSFILTYIAAISSLLGTYIIIRFLYFTIQLNIVYVPFSLITRTMSILGTVTCSYLALKNENIKKIIVYSTSLQISYIFLLLSILTAKALLLHFLIIDSVNKIGLFTLLAHIENKSSNLIISSIPKIRNSTSFKVLAGFVLLFSSSLPFSSMFMIKVMIFELLIEQKLFLEFVSVLISSVFSIIYHLKISEAIFFTKGENGFIKIDTNLLGLFVIVIVHMFTLLYTEEIACILRVFF